MDKIKTIKIKNADGSISEESYTIAADALNVDMANGKNLQETIGAIDIDTDGNIASQLNNLKDNDTTISEDIVNINNDMITKLGQLDIEDNLTSVNSNKVLSAKQGKILNDKIDININSINNINTTLITKINEAEADIKYSTKTELNENVASLTASIGINSARIDSLSHLEEGSTTGDAELIDGRISQDGYKYTSIGNAIRNQLNDLENGLQTGSKEVNIRKYMPEIDWEQGAFNTNTGLEDDTYANYNIRTNSTYNTSIIYNKKLITKEDTNRLQVWFYNENDEPMTVLGTHRSIFKNNDIMILNLKDVPKIKLSINDNNAVITPSHLDNYFIEQETFVLNSINSENAKNLNDFEDKAKNIINKERPIQEKMLFYGNELGNNKIAYGNIGDTISIITQNYQTYHKFEISENFNYYVTHTICNNINGANWYITNADEKIIAKGYQSSIQYPAYIPKTSNAKYLYINVTNNNIGCVYKEINNFNLYNGDKINYELNTINYINTKNTIHNVNTININLTDSVELSFNDIYCNTIGLWIKIPYSERNNITKINFKVYKNNTQLQTADLSNFHFNQIGYMFIKLMVGSMQQSCNKIIITPTFSNNVNNVNLEISDKLILDQYTKPYICINFDQAWQATEDCGLYNDLINNQVPFTITGVLDRVDSATQQKLMQAVNSGILEIGCYGNEQYQNDSNTYYVHDGVNSYEVMQQEMNKLLTKKMTYYPNPITFGERGHVITPLIRRCLINNGFKIHRYATGDSNISSLKYNSLFDNELITISEIGFRSDLKNCGNAGSGEVIFTHGVSIDRTKEDNPANYANYDPNFINNLIYLRENCGIDIIQMRDIYNRSQNV